MKKWSTQTELGHFLHLDAKEVGRLLKRLGYRKPDGDPTSDALRAGLCCQATMRDGTEFYLWHTQKTTEILQCKRLAKSTLRKHLRQSRKTEYKGIEVYTDGGCYSNPGPGGWGVYIPEHDIRRSGASARTTNNRMELTAIIQAFEALKELNIPKALVYSDSQYSVKGLNDWLPIWRKKNWLNSEKESVKNADLWLMLDALHRPGWKLVWVKGHNGNPGNEIADHLASQYRLQQSFPAAINTQS